jgi:hypothetical protein
MPHAPRLLRVRPAGLVAARHDAAAQASLPDAHRRVMLARSWSPVEQRRVGGCVVLGRGWAASHATP